MPSNNPQAYIDGQNVQDMSGRDLRLGSSDARLRGGIVRPQKPPLVPAQAVMGGNSVSGYTPEDMPIDVMTQGAPATPVGVPDRVGDIVVTPEVTTTELPASGGDSGSMPAGALLAVPAVAAAVAMAKRTGRANVVGNQQLDAMGVSIDGEILDPERAMAAGLIDAQGQIIEGTATDVTPQPKQITEQKRMTNGDGIDSVAPDGPQATTSHTVDGNPDPYNETVITPASDDDPVIQRAVTAIENSPESAAVATEDILPPDRRTGVPDGVSLDEDVFSGRTAETLVQAETLDTGEQMFRDSNRGDFVVRHPDGQGGALRAPTKDALRRALRALR